MTCHTCQTSALLTELNPGPKHNFQQQVCLILTLVHVIHKYVMARQLQGVCKLKQRKLKQGKTRSNPISTEEPTAWLAGDQLSTRSDEPLDMNETASAKVTHVRLLKS
jgi:hypothetical protein